MPTVVETASEAELPDHYEVVNGRVVEIAPMSAFSGEIANRVRDELTAYCRASRRGRARNDMLFCIPQAEDQTRNRAPDVAFMSFDRWPESRPMLYRGNPVDVVPNIAVEVVSPTDDAEDVLAKTYEYLRGGVELVWVIFPHLRHLYAYTAPSAAPQLFTEADTLDGGTVLPGFSVAMAGLFPAMADTPQAEGDE